MGRLLPIERRAQSSDDSDGWEEPIAATPDDDGCSDSVEGSSENEEAPNEEAPFSANTGAERAPASAEASGTVDATAPKEECTVLSEETRADCQKGLAQHKEHFPQVQESVLLEKRAH